MSSVLLCILREHFSSVCSVQRGGLGLLFLAFEFLRWSAHSQSVISPSAAQHRTLNAFLVYVCVCVLFPNHTFCYMAVCCACLVYSDHRSEAEARSAYIASRSPFSSSRATSSSPLPHLPPLRCSQFAAQGSGSLFAVVIISSFSVLPAAATPLSHTAPHNLLHV